MLENEIREIEVGMQRVFADNFLRAQTHVERDAALRAFEVSVSGLFVSDVTIRYPRDWWHAFKARWFPEFILARWPVEYVEYYIKSSDRALDLNNA
jgi:hypothetical protein